MNWQLPPAVARIPEAGRLLAAVQASVATGAALCAMRGAEAHAVEVGTQLKTPIDRAAEGWILGYLTSQFPGDAYLAEERHAESDGMWQPPAAYWTIDALDGTRSFVGGFPGFCVQVAFVDRQGPRFGVIYEPVAAATYLGVRHAGAYRRLESGPWERMLLPAASSWRARPRFVDSTPPAGPVGELLRQRQGHFVECGSIGLKICRVAAGEADVFVKKLSFKLWDVAPGDVILSEAGGRLGTWDGARVDYGVGPVVRHDVLAAAPTLFTSTVDFLTAIRR